MRFLKKLFIKNYTNTNNPAVHHRYGVVAGIIGIICNILMSALGITIGLISGSITITIQAIANLSDAASSVLTLIGFKLSAKPADKEHPFGHARVEYICGFLITIIMLIVGVFSAKSSIDKIITPTDLDINLYLYIVLCFIIITKLFLMIMYRSFAKSIKSDTLKASSLDSRNDMIANIAVLISMIIMQVTNINIDGYIGLAVSIFILISAIKMTIETIDPLISVKPHKRLVSKIKKEILSFEGVHDIHDLLVHTYGSGSTFATVHIEINEDTTLLDCHELVDKIERHFEDELNINLTIQVDPIDLDDPKDIKIYNKVKRTLKALNKKLSIHGLRVIEEPNKIKVLFDILEDFDSNLTKKKITSELNNAFAKEPVKYEFIFTIDKPFT